MGPEKSNRHEKRLIRRPLQGFCNFLRELKIRHAFIGVGESSPIPSGTPVGRTIELHLGPRASSSSQISINILRKSSPKIVMQDFATGDRDIPVIFEVSMHRGRTTECRQFLILGAEFVTSMGCGRGAGNHADPRGRAYWNHAVGIGEVDAAASQSVHVGCQRLRVTSKKADPVIEVVDADHQHVWAARFVSFDSAQQKRSSEYDQTDDCSPSLFKW